MLESLSWGPFQNVNTFLRFAASCINLMGTQFIIPWDALQYAFPPREKGFCAHCLLRHGYFFQHVWTNHVAKAQRHLKMKFSFASDPEAVMYDVKCEILTLSTTSTVGPDNTVVHLQSTQNPSGPFKGITLVNSNDITINSNHLAAVDKHISVSASQFNVSTTYKMPWMLFCKK